MRHHVPVLGEEVRALMRVKEQGIYVDATCGSGGHSRILLESADGVRVIGIDKDEEAVRRATDALAGFPGFTAVRGGFEHLGAILRSCGVDAVDGILFDLGFSSCQMSDDRRGFSFLREGPLDMRFDRASRLTAWEIVNCWSRQRLGRLLKEYADIRHPWRLVDRIVERRERMPFDTTTDLAAVLSWGRRRGRIHPATRVFQALRIAVNDELGALGAALPQAVDALASGGRILVISFHSGEDRLVKRFFREESRLRQVTKKPVRPSPDEVRHHRESRSARLRAAERI